MCRRCCCCCCWSPSLKVVAKLHIVQPERSHARRAAWQGWRCQKFSHRLRLELAPEYFCHHELRNLFILCFNFHRDTRHDLGSVPRRYLLHFAVPTRPRSLSRATSYFLAALCLCAKVYFCHANSGWGASAASCSRRLSSCPLLASRQHPARVLVRTPIAPHASRPLLFFLHLPRYAIIARSASSTVHVVPPRALLTAAQCVCVSLTALLFLLQTVVPLSQPP